MKNIFLLLPLVSILIISCNRDVYSLYKHSMIFDTVHVNSGSKLLIVRECHNTDDSQFVALCDANDLKYSCYKRMSFAEFNRTIGLKIYEGKCIKNICRQSKIFKFSNKQYQLFASLGVDSIKKAYFVDGRSKNSYESNSPSIDFLIALSVLFDSNYQIFYEGSIDNYFHIIPFLTNEEVKGVMRRASMSN